MLLNPPVHPEPEHATPVPPTPLQQHKVTLNAGTLIPVRLVDSLSTDRSKPGDPFTATLDQELIADDFVIAERGARVEGRVVATYPANRSGGTAELIVALTRIRTADGQNVSIRTDAFERHAEPESAVRNGSASRAGSGIAAIIAPQTHIRFRLGTPVTLIEHAR